MGGGGGGRLTVTYLAVTSDLLDSDPPQSPFSESISATRHFFVVSGVWVWGFSSIVNIFERLIQHSTPVDWTKLAFVYGQA